jgi:hypothetical protein
MSAPRIITRYDPPPIPTREFDWVAVEDDYDLGRPVGYGRTEKDAEDDLISQLDAMENGGFAQNGAKPKGGLVEEQAEAER